MKIIHVEDRFEPTAGYQINELLKEQSKMDNEIVVISSTMSIFSNENELVNQDAIFEKETGVKVIRLKPLFVFSSRYYFNNLFKIIDDLKPDIVFLHGIVDFKDLILFGPKKSYYICRDCHMSWVASKNRFSKNIAKVFSSLFSKKINISNKYKMIYSLGIEESQYLESIGIDNKMIEYLPHGYNSDEMFFSNIARKEIRNKYSISEDEVLISYIGKFDKNKRPDIVLDIIDALGVEYKKNIKLLFVGNMTGDYEKLIYKKVSQYNLLSKCTFIEAQPYKLLYKFFSASDICIWPKETTLSSIHAQVCHSIPIMENHDSNKERVIDNRSLFEKNNIDDAVSILEFVIDNYSSFDFKAINSDLKSRDYKTTTKKLNAEWETWINEKNDR